jgi:hypothetical protein
MVDQIDEKRIAVVAAPKTSSYQIVPELYEGTVDGFRGQGQRVEVVQIQLFSQAEGESITMSGGEGGSA